MVGIAYHGINSWEEFGALRERELRMLFKRIDTCKQQRTKATNRANSILTGHGFTVFRLVTMNSPARLHILQAIIDQETPEEIAALHRNGEEKWPPRLECAANWLCPVCLILLLFLRLDSCRMSISYMNYIKWLT